MDSSKATAQTHQSRVKSELKEAGITNFGLRRYPSNYLPRIMHDEEHIMAAVLGRLKKGAGLLSLNEGMLVATDRRVLFIDHRPGYTTMDEISYDTISGVNMSTAAGFAGIVLYTRVQNYTLSFTNQVASQKFSNYIETRRIDKEMPQTGF